MALDLHREKTLLHHGRGTREIRRGRLISGVAAWGYDISAFHLDHQALWRADMLQ